MVHLDTDKRPASMAEVKEVLQRVAAHHETIQANNAVWSAEKKMMPSLDIDVSPALGTLLYSYHGHYDSINTLAWSPDSTAIVSGTVTIVEVWKALSGEPLLPPHRRIDVTAVDWSPDGKYIAEGASRDETVQIRDATTGKIVRAHQGLDDWVVVMPIE